ncbi:hypothetical protein RvY_08338 [Ramazzottius varieornatus]|uniref:Receptor ligand binding region domain-containing protein n=1 Tax=Ramazzottius varieornatus TaxID=947166 RepID=A0A1D1V865_RAMVA|nr:hypothetical protein RvY_08338 [Ramazzottius varieornatus]
MVFRAYRSLLLQSPLIPGQNDDTKRFLADLKERALKDTPPECNRTTFTGQVLSQIMNSKSSAAVERLQTLGSSPLVEYFRNRSFQTPAGTVYFDQTGARRSPMSISQYDPMTRQLTVIWTASPLKFGMEQVHEPMWLLGHAPPNAPPCGFNGELCQEQSSGTMVRIGSSVAAAVILLIGAATALEWRRYHCSTKAPAWKATCTWHRRSPPLV